jgi:hypothetical protein
MYRGMEENLQSFGHRMTVAYRLYFPTNLFLEKSSPYAVDRRGMMTVPVKPSLSYLNPWLVHPVALLSVK